VRAATSAQVDAAALNEAVAHSLASAAPSDPVQAFLDNLHTRVTQIETTLGMTAPIVAEGLTLAGSVVPGIAPYVNGAESLLTWAAELTEAIHKAFSGKINLPPLPSAEGS
jgi:hypothetical protein